MSTSMPYPRPVEVTAQHVAQLRMTGPQGLLVWQENLGTAAVWAPTAWLDAYTMVIASGWILHTLAEEHPGGSELTDAQLASELTVLGNDVSTDWPQVQAMTHLLTPIRRRVWEGYGICLAQAPEYEHHRDGARYITDTYAYPEEDLHARVRVAFAYQAPTRIDLYRPGQELCQAAEICLDISCTTPVLTRALLIAQTIVTALGRSR